MIESWAPIPGLPGYDVSSLGRARSWKAMGPGKKTRLEPKLLTVRLGHNGYLKFNCTYDDRPGTMDVHRAMGLAFLGEPPTSSHQVDHMDHVRTNCILTNLEWKTPSENLKNRPPLRRTAEFRHRVLWARVIDKKSYGQIAAEFGIDHKTARDYAAAKP